MDNTTTSNQLQNSQSAINQNVTTNTMMGKDPYAPAIPNINQILGEGANLYGTYPAGGGNVPDVAWQALQTQQELAGQAGTPLQMSQNRLLSGGWTPEMYAPLAQLGTIANGQNPLFQGNYQQLWNDATTNFNTPLNWYAQNYDQLQPLASNVSGALTPTQQAILDQNAERISNRQASLYSGAGRYGSFGAGLGTARGIAETNNPLIAQFSDAAIKNALAANSLQGQLGQWYTGALGTQGALRGTAAAGLTNIQQQDIANRMLAANSQLSNANQAAARELGWAQAAPTLYNLAMAPTMGQLEMDTKLEQYPWQQLGYYGQATTGLSPLIQNTGVQTNTGNIGTTTQANTVGNVAGSNTTPTPWTTFAGLGLAGLGFLGL